MQKGGIRMKEMLEQGLRKLGAGDTIDSYEPVSGGDINEAFYVRTREQAFFVKLNRNVRADFFEFEKRGLEEMRQAQAVAVPEVYGIVSDDDSGIPMLWLEWITGEKQDDTEHRLGEGLAALHNKTGSKFGLDGSSYIGKLVQKNMLTDSWLEYYRDFRLAGQLQLGKARGTIGGCRERMLVKLMERLDGMIPEQPEASLLHGDLWGGNWMAGKGGTPYLIDPSILYGDHEFEIAFTKLFGGFSGRFYTAYNESFLLSDSYKDKEPVYQLYYLLVHLNMFGESYGSSVDSILGKYV